jgi:1,4-dihydroxy-2-naphthoate octaprenyltransferase
VYVQAGRVSWAALACAVAVGSFSTAVLTANNLRDIPTDVESGKRTLATRLGDGGTRRLYLVLIAVPYVLGIVLGIFHPLLLITLLTAPMLPKSVRAVGGGAHGRELIPALRDTGLAMLAWAVLAAVALGF